MKKNDEFYVSYIAGSLGEHTKRALKGFVLVAMLFIVGAALVFALSQNQFKNSTFELSSETKITGVFHENPYPMLQVKLSENTFKNVLLLGFGKRSVNPYLKDLRTQVGELKGKKLSIEGNLIYYNGKTLIQITDKEKVMLLESSPVAIMEKESLGQVSLQGEVVDPKCYFGVMKPGYGKIHRSCAVLCISGGIPPVFRVKQQDGSLQYYLITDLEGNPMHKEILPYVGKPIAITGAVENNNNWYTLKIATEDIKLLDAPSDIY